MSQQGAKVWKFSNSTSRITLFRHNFYANINLSSLEAEVFSSLSVNSMTFRCGEIGINNSIDPKSFRR
jgi:hypothetical protein